MEILCFFAGIVSAYTKSIYPVLLVGGNYIFKPKCLVLVSFLAGIVWGLAHQWMVTEHGMPSVQSIPNAVIEGKVLTTPIGKHNGKQWQFLISKLNAHPAQSLLLLSCYQNCPTLHVGQIWQFRAKLHKPHNLANPGSFDYVTWLTARHLVWTGYIKNGSAHLLTAVAQPHNLLFLREYLANLLKQAILDPKIFGISQALSVGITTNISPELWDLFRRTGTIHLLVISGAHIGLIALLSYKLTKWLWARCGSLPLYYPAIKVASILALILAFLYSLLAGLAIPAQRAVVACLFLFMRNFLNYKFTGWQGWRYGLLAVLLFEPHAVLFPGFYLSFIAVAILILVNQRFAWQGLKKVIYVQLACLIGLMPLTIHWFSYAAFNGLIANIVAIPLISFFIIPLTLLSLLLFCCFKAPIIFLPLSFLIKVLLIYLHWVDNFNMININFTFPNATAPLAILLSLALIVLLPLKNIYFPAIILASASLFPQSNKVKLGNAHIAILDVGQGLAIVVNTATHNLVYDTGAKFYQSEGDLAKFAVIPYLNTLRITKLDKIVISHPDLDHRGGLASLEAKYPNTELIVDHIEYYKRGLSCHDYPPWEWDEVKFRFLAINTRMAGKNNNSCILQISNHAGKVLLTGDIEHKAENYLINTYGKDLQSEVLLVPHHGSKTSSSRSFVNQVAPQYAIISAGLDNRYHFPHAQTIATLNYNKTVIYNTIDCGMIQIKLLARRREIVSNCYKKCQ